MQKSSRRFTLLSVDWLSLCPDYSILFQQIILNGFDTSLLTASFWSVYISTIFAIMTTQIISKVFSTASFLIMTNCMRQLPRFMFWYLFPQYLHCQSFNAVAFDLFKCRNQRKNQICTRLSFAEVFCNISFTWKCVTRIPSEMVVALRYTLVTLLKVLYTA